MLLLTSYSIYSTFFLIGVIWFNSFYVQHHEYDRQNSIDTLVIFIVSIFYYLVPKLLLKFIFAIWKIPFISSFYLDVIWIQINHNHFNHWVVIFPLNLNAAYHCFIRVFISYFEKNSNSYFVPHNKPNHHLFCNHFLLKHQYSISIFQINYLYRFL